MHSLNTMAALNNRRVGQNEESGIRRRARALGRRLREDPAARRDIEVTVARLRARSALGARSWPTWPSTCWTGSGTTDEP